MLVPPKIWLSEGDTALDILAGRYTFWAPCSFLHKSEIQTAWADTGYGGTVIGGQTNSGSQTMLDAASLKLKIRNLNVHPYYLKVYWCVAKREYDCASGIQQQVILDLVNGWTDRALAADLTTIGLTNSGVSCYSKMLGLNIFQSTEFLSKWHVIKGRGGIVQSGQTIDLSWNMPKSRTYHYGRFTRGDEDTIAHLTVVPLFKVHMSLGNDTTSTAEFLGLDGHIHVQCFEKMVFRYNTPHLPIIAFTNSKDDAFTVGGEGPADPEMKVDD